MKYWIVLIFFLWAAGLSLAQEDATPYEIALARIAETKASGATILDLSYLRLTELPAEIGELSDLFQLILSSNQLTGLPPEIGNLSNLESLILDHNLLTELPPEIGNLWHLKELDLSYNHLSGLPSEMAHLGNLCLLSIQNNLFQNMPLEIRSLKALGARENCIYSRGYSRYSALLLDEQLLATIPFELANNGTNGILNYLDSEAEKQMWQGVARWGAAPSLLLLLLLGWRWKNRRGKRKRKNHSY